MTNWKRPVIYGLWDRSSSIQNPVMREYIRDMNRLVLSDFENDILVGPDLTILVEKAIATGCGFLAVFRSGHVSQDVHALANGIEAFCKNNEFMIAGHILHRAGRYPYIHDQFLILNLNRYVEAGRPPLQRIGASVSLHEPERSQENVHDDYTPLWLRPTGGRIDGTTYGFAQEAISASLDRGWPVLNVPPAIKASKVFLYPENNADAFAANILRMRNGEMPDLDNGMDFSQRRYLNDIHDPVLQTGTFVLNTEKVVDRHMAIRCHPPFQQLVVVCAGLKPFMLWNEHCTPDARVIYYDKYPRNIAFWQDALANWDGYALDRFVLERNPSAFDPASGSMYFGRKIAGLSKLDNFRKNMEAVHVQFGSEDAFAAKWREFAILKPVFVQSDLLVDTDALMGAMHPGLSTMVWASNIFYFHKAFKLYGLAKVREQFNNFVHRLRAFDEDTVLLARSPLKVDIASTVAEIIEA